MSPSPSPEKGGDSDLHKVLDHHGLRLGEDNFVEWNPDEKQHPRNWPLFKKTYNVFLVCFFEFWMTAISSSGTAASETGREEYHLSRTVGYLMFTSLYLFGQATGSVCCSPISETFGRRNVYMASIAVYCAFNAIIAAVPSSIAVCFGRFITGAASAIPATVAFGSFDDMFKSETRIWIVYIYTLFGNCGLVLGPIYSAYVSTYAGWRWVFYISTIVSGFGIFASYFLNESRTGYLLELKVKEIHQETSTSSLKVPHKEKITLRSFLQTSLFRPLLFLVSEPMVFSCAVLMAISFSLIYGLTEGITVVYSSPPFSFSESTTSSLPFLALLVGLVVDILPRFYEQRKFSRYRAQHRPLLPETKIDSLALAAPALAIGLWLFAWTVPPLVTNVHWIASMVGLAFVGFATNDLSYLLFGYLTDSYGQYAASACAALSLSRTLMAGIFPLFTETMYEGLGANKATTVFACVATVFCATPVVVIRYGERVRRMSPWARGSVEKGDEGEGEGGGEEGAGGEAEGKTEDSGEV
ncbi:MAG: hypothetical protein MMC23_008127 [Stictis urceolatum]|nr:hypothetical protein [Stictis urceolata]